MRRNGVGAEERPIAVIIIGGEEVIIERADAGKVEEGTTARAGKARRVGLAKIDSGKEGPERRVAVDEGGEEQ